MAADYYNTAEVLAACKHLQQHHAQHVRLLTLSEPSHEGRAIVALRLCEDTTNPKPKPVFMLIGGLHGSEWGSTEILINFAADLVQGRASGLDYGGATYSREQVQSVLDGLDLLLVPLANPDGRFFSQTNGEFWRKNRSTMEASTGAAIGVDLNRNFDHLFAESVQPMTSPFYAGPGPLSEPETINIDALVQAWDPSWFVDLHSGARCVVYPWSVEQPTFAMPAADVLAHQQLGGVYAEAAQKVSGMPVPVVPGFQFVSASGTSHDWVYARARPPSLMPGELTVAERTRTRAFSIEWSGDPVPLWFDMQALMRETAAGLVAMCLAALVH